MDVLISLAVVIVSLCIHLSKHQIVYLTYIQFLLIIAELSYFLEKKNISEMHEVEEAISGQYLKCHLFSIKIKNQVSYCMCLSIPIELYLRKSKFYCTETKKRIKNIMWPPKGKFYKLQKIIIYQSCVKYGNTKKRAFGLSNFVPAINKHIDNGSLEGQRWFTVLRNLEECSRRKPRGSPVRPMRRDNCRLWTYQKIKMTRGDE